MKQVYKDEELKIHPAAMLMPEMPEDEYIELKASIKMAGLQDSIVILNGEIIDGRHRFRACMELGISPHRKTLGERYGTLTDPYQYVIATNLHRRHLTTSQKAAIGVELKKHYAKLAKERQKCGQGGSLLVDNCPQAKGKARDEAGKTLGIAGRTIDRAEKVDKVSPVLVNEIKNGRVTLNSATELVKSVSEDELPKVVERVSKSKDPKKEIKAATPRKTPKVVQGEDKTDEGIKELVKQFKGLSKEGQDEFLSALGLARRAKKRV